MFDAEQARAKAPPPDPRATQSLDDIVAARRKEDARVAEITRIAAEAIEDRPPLVGEFEKMARAAIENKATVAEFELAVMRVRATAGPGVFHPTTDVRAGAKVIEAALCLAGGLDEKSAEKHYGQQTLNAAADQFPRGIGLRDLLVMAARHNGHHGHTTGDLLALQRAAFAASGNGVIRADGFSTLSLPGILSNVANKFLAAGFNAVEDGWREISAMRNVRDFKTSTSYSLTGGMIYEKVGPSGELKHGNVGELSYTNKAETYGRMFAITRQDIINDDLGALTQLPMKLGRGAALKLNDVFWTEFLANVGTFYSTGNLNYISGGTSVLAASALTLVLAKFRRQTDPDGLPLGISPKILLVPPELEITADELMTATAFNTGGSSTTDRVPNRNTWAGKYRVVTSSYLSNSNYTGYSTTAWYLLADPADLPVIEVAFLNGRETPVVESADAEFNTLGIQMRGYHDFGVSKQEYRAGVRAAGA
jgi:phage major head subunit gpT-like protein